MNNVLFHSISLSSHLTNRPTILFFKRHMFMVRKILPAVTLIPKTSPKVLIRYPSLVAEGTLLNKSDYQDIKKILYLHNRYLFNLNFLKNLDYQSFDFYNNVMLINPKFFQHILSIAYPKAQFSLDDLRRYFPNIGVQGGKTDLLITEDALIAAIGASIMKKAPLFKQGSLTVLACEYDPKVKKEKINQLALFQTKQKHPDYYYVYKPLNNQSGLWVRYYDFKTGKQNINTGHIRCTSDKAFFEKEAAQLLYAQLKKYNDKPHIQKGLKEILDNPNLTWLERNERAHSLYRDNLQVNPDMNPSIIIYNPLMYEIDQMNIPKNINYPVTQSCMESVETTQKVLAETIYEGGVVCRENYLKHPYNCPIIVGYIRKMIANTSEL